jgi:hypothetical protein
MPYHSGDDMRSKRIDCGIWLTKQFIIEKKEIPTEDYVTDLREMSCLLKRLNRVVQCTWQDK